jgi:hypothetical protein
MPADKLHRVKYMVRRTNLMEVLTQVVLRYANEELWSAKVFMLCGCGGEKSLLLLCNPEGTALGRGVRNATTCYRNGLWEYCYKRRVSSLSQYTAGFLTRPLLDVISTTRTVQRIRNNCTWLFKQDISQKDGRLRNIQAVILLTELG